MDRLSPEIISLIVKYLFPVRPGEHVKGQYHSSSALISRQWQHAVERHTVARINTKSTELEAFEAIFSRPGRAALIRNLGFTVMLPTYGDSRQNFATNIDKFNSGVKKLFQILARWDHDDRQNRSQSGSLKLVLDAGWDVNPEEGPFEFHFDVSKSSAAGRYLTLEDTELPPLRRVTAFEIVTYGGRALHPSTMCQLAAAMPNLEDLELEILDPVMKRHELRRSHRIALGTGLRNLRLPKLARFLAGNIEGSTPDNHSFECGDLEVEGVDILNDGIRRLAQTSPITHLELQDWYLSQDLFRDRTSRNAKSATWPALRHFDIAGGIVAPSGAWYYTGNPESVEPSTPSSVDSPSIPDSDDTTDSHGDDDRDAIANRDRPTHCWRNRPDPDVFNELVEAMTNAITQMPQLKLGLLNVGMDLNDPVGIEFQCAEAGQKIENAIDLTSEPEMESLVRRWKAWIGLDATWTVPAELRAKWTRWVGSGGKVAVGPWPL